MFGRRPIRVCAVSAMGIGTRWAYRCPGPGTKLCSSPRWMAACCWLNLCGARQPVSIISLPSQTQMPAVVQSTCVSRDGSVWIGTDGKGLYHYQSGQVTNCGTPLNPSDLFICSVLEDRETNVWLGTKSGL